MADCTCWREEPPTAWHGRIQGAYFLDGAGGRTGWRVGSEDWGDAPLCYAKPRFTAYSSGRLSGEPVVHFRIQHEQNWAAGCRNQDRRRIRPIAKLYERALLWINR